MQSDILDETDETDGSIFTSYECPDNEKQNYQYWNNENKDTKDK